MPENYNSEHEQDVALARELEQHIHVEHGNAESLDLGAVALGGNNREDEHSDHEGRVEDVETAHVMALAADKDASAAAAARQISKDIEDYFPPSATDASYDVEKRADLEEQTDESFDRSKKKALETIGQRGETDLYNHLGEESWINRTRVARDVADDTSLYNRFFREGSSHKVGDLEKVNVPSQGLNDRDILMRGVKEKDKRADELAEWAKVLHEHPVSEQYAETHPGIDFSPSALIGMDKLVTDNYEHLTGLEKSIDEATFATALVGFIDIANSTLADCINELEARGDEDADAEFNQWNSNPDATNKDIVAIYKSAMKKLHITPRSNMVYSAKAIIDDIKAGRASAPASHP